MVQWIRICLPVQGSGVQSLVKKIPRALAQLSSCATTTEPRSRARAPKQGKPLQGEAWVPQLGKAHVYSNEDPVK